MARNVNKVTLLGNLTSDPELRHTGGGTAVCNFGMATNESFKDADGAWQERPAFHNLVAWGRAAEVICEYLKKGSGLYVEGSLQYGSYEKDGATVRTTEIKVKEFVFTGGAGGGSQPGNDEGESEDGLPF